MAVEGSNAVGKGQGCCSGGLMGARKDKFRANERTRWPTGRINPMKWRG